MRVWMRRWGGEMEAPVRRNERTGQPVCRCGDFSYRTRWLWSRARRVIGKDEHHRRGANPRFVVISLTIDEVDAQDLYEQKYCARCDIENRIKEQQLDRFADRTSSHQVAANQLRVAFASCALCTHREDAPSGCPGHPLGARAQ